MEWDRRRSEARSLTAVETAVVDAICYADAFAWPLTQDEIHAALPLSATGPEVREALGSPRLRPILSFHGDLVALAGRAALFERRRIRSIASRALWPRAVQWAGRIARLPSVRLVGVTGSLAVGAAAADDDIDLFVVTADERLWLTRAAAIAVGRAAALAGVRLCPNYLVAESALALPERDVVTAHELAQLVPIAGAATYERLLAANAWYRDHVPNHRPATVTRRGAGAGPLDALVGARPLDRLERWEMARKVRRLRAEARTDEQRFGRSVCKGHVAGHRERTLHAYATRRAAVLGTEAAA